MRLVAWMWTGAMLSLGSADLSLRSNTPGVITSGVLHHAYKHDVDLSRRTMQLCMLMD